MRSGRSVAVFLKWKWIATKCTHLRRNPQQIQRNFPCSFRHSLGKLLGERVIAAVERNVCIQKLGGRCVVLHRQLANLHRVVSTSQI